MLYKSFGIIRTNVGLTTNVKLMVSSDYKLYMDSIESNSDLSLSRFKKFRVNKKDRYDRLIPNFYKDFPSDLAFDIKYDNDVDSMKDDFRFQYDEIYQYGARNIDNNKDYSEEFEYFAPLYVFPDNLPKSFIIFRVDNPGLDIYTKDNFRDIVVRNFKTVKNFDLTTKSTLGEWLDINYTRNDSFPISPLEIDFKRNEFSRLNGIDYKTGGYINKSILLDEWFSQEREIFETEKFIFDKYRDSKLVFPNILNLSFLFDDTPSTPDKERKWSLNRYYGFYFDEQEHVVSVFPTKTKSLKTDITINSSNIIEHSSGYPFIEEWNDNIDNYIEINGVFYLVRRIKETKEPEIPSEIVENLEDDVVIVNITNNTSTTNINSAFIENFENNIYYLYKIISTKDLSTYSYNDINSNTSIIINSNNQIVKIKEDGLEEKYSIDLFENSDIWLIQINGILHNIIIQDGYLKLVTDYSFNFDLKSNYYSYKVGGKETRVSLLRNRNVDPEEFKIFRLKFTDLKDFDTRIVDTEPSKFEYELENELTDTDETKMYLTDLNSDTNPKEMDSFVINDKLVNIPVSSEYTANYETFKITENGLTELWRKNSVYCRWGFQKSLSSNDYPYVLNNSLLFEDFNRTTNIIESDPKRIERNLDYFYTINSDGFNYKHHSLHIEDYIDDSSLNEDYRFDVDKYLDSDGYDYFSNFFNRRSNFLNNRLSRNTIKHSYFNKGDRSIPNITLFRGIKFLIYDVQDIRKNENGGLDVVNLTTSNTFQDYKFSILLSDNKTYSTETIEENYTVKSCETPVSHNLSTILTPSFVDSSGEPRKLFHDGSEQTGLIGKYILSGLSMSSSNISVPNITTTEYCSHQVLYKIYSVGTDPLNDDRPYITLVDINGEQITDTDKLPEYLGNFYTIDSIDDYPYILLNNDTKIGFNDNIKIENSTDIYGTTVIERGEISGSQYIKVVDNTYDNIIVPSGSEITLPNGSTGSITYDIVNSENSMEWLIIDQWQMDKIYATNSYVYYDDIIYRTTKQVVTTNPITTKNGKLVKSCPYNIDGFEQFKYYDRTFSPFYSFGVDYVLNDVIYSNGDYFILKDIYSNVDFWNPYRIDGYELNSRVLHKGKYYESLISNNIFSPSDNYEGNWKEVNISESKWKRLNLWSPSFTYTTDDYIVHNSVVYYTNMTTEIGEEPGISSKWNRKFSLVPDTTIQYDFNKNPFIRFNNKYYLIKSNRTDSTLENGIKVYINKKWKNILINIEIKDNTTPNLKNVNRDELYIDLNKKLTANNFINCINDFSNTYDFIDYLEYIIIQEDGSINRYDFNNIDGLPYLINCDFPDSLETKISSLNTTIIDLKNDIIAKNKLKDSELVNNTQINYYNGNPIAVRIDENKNEPKTFVNYSENKNFTNNILYRFSGFYMPIFYDVHMFYKGVQRVKSTYDFETVPLPVVSFDKVDTPPIVWMNPIPEGEFSYRTFTYDNKFNDPSYNVTLGPYFPGIYQSPIKSGWDAVLVNAQRNASYYHYALPDDKKYVLSGGLVSSQNSSLVDYTKLNGIIERDKNVYKTPHDITPYIGWYIIASEYVKTIYQYSYLSNPGYYDILRNGGTSFPIVVMYKINNAYFNEKTGYYEFSVLDPDGSPTEYMVNHIYDLMLVENLNDNFGVFVNNKNLELKEGDIVDIKQIDCELNNNNKPFYIKSIIEHNNGYILDIYDSTNNRVSFDDGCKGKIELPKSIYTQNYRFNTELSYFGNMLERKISKINRKGSKLKLKEKTNIRSIYPMLDEFGYTFIDFFVFKGTFDLNYHVETYDNEYEASLMDSFSSIVQNINLGKK